MSKSKHKTLVFALFALAASVTQTRAQSIYTPYAFTNFAGQPGGPGIADGTGRGARFKSPSGTAVDVAGNVYVADQNNFTIRKITPAGVVTTIAGSPGMIGTNDGVGSAARFGSVFGGPGGVAVDSATNVYVSDTANYTIRKITLVGTNWTVTTLAGKGGQSGTTNGTGSAARFAGPSGLAVDSAGNVYVADGFAIRRVTPAGEVTTLAGSALQSGSTDGTNSVARFGSFAGGPRGVAVDGATNIYVADTYNSTIRRVSPLDTNWVVTTFSGSAGLIGFADGTNQVPRFYNPYGVAVDNTGNIYVADSAAQTIRKIVFIGTNRVVTTFAGTATIFGSDDGTGSAARFQFPEGAAADSGGNVYVADFGNNTIRKITPGAVVTTLAGQVGGPGAADGTGNAAQFDIPRSVALDSATNVYVSDTQNHTIRKITPAGVVTTIAGSPGNHGYADGVGTAQPARFNKPKGPTVDGAGNLYVADSLNYTIRKVTPAAVVTTLAGSAGQQGTANGTGSAAQFNSPAGVVTDSATNVYVADQHAIRKITPAGVVTTFAGSITVAGTNDGVGTAARFRFPKGMAVDSAGNVFVADSSNHTLRKITPGGVVTTLAGYGGESGTNDGIGSAARFSGPEGVAVDSAGTIYVTDTDNYTIRKITPGGTVTTLAGTAEVSGNADGTNGTAGFESPTGLAIDSATNLYVTDSYGFGSSIRKLTPVGTNWVVTTIAGSAEENENVDGTNGAARFHFLQGVAVDSAGTLYVTDWRNETIRKITHAGTNWVVTTFAGTGGQTGSADGTGAAALFYQPQELTVDGAGNIYVVEFGNSTVRKIAPVGTNWVVTTLAGCASCAVGTNDGPGIAARFRDPFGLTRDSSGNLYVADTSSFTIRKLTPSGTNWAVTTFAGTPGQQGLSDATGSNARFNGPVGLAADAAGNIYVADGFSIRRITSAGVVTTLAGCPSGGCTNAIGSTDGLGTVARFGLPRGVAVDSATNIFVADYSNDTIRKLTPAGSDWMVTTLGGLTGQASVADGIGSDARFNAPSGVAVDSAGNIYVVNSGENSIAKGTPYTAPVVVQFDTVGGSLTVSNGFFQMRVTGSFSGSLVLESSTNLLSWTPIQTNALPPGGVLISAPLGTKQKQFFRARLVP